MLGGLIAVNLLKKEEGQEVTAEKVERGTVIKKVTGSGQVEPAVEVKISANVSGKILAINAKEGDRVKEGDLLVELDREQYVANLQRAESGLLSAIDPDRIEAIIKQVEASLSG